MAAVIANATALNAVVSSSTAMTAVASSQTAMAAVAASQTAMAAVAASYVAVAAVYGSAVAVDAVKTNETAWATLTGATSAVMGKAVAVLSGLNPDSYADMTAVASSSTAMTAIAASTEALKALNSSSLKKTYTVSSAGTNSYVTVKSGNLLVLSLIGTGSNMWTAKGFTVPNTGNITFNTTAVTLCKTANNLQVAYGSSSTSQTATITGIPV